MEKIRLRDGSEYNVIPGGFQSDKNENGNDMLRIVLEYNENISLEDIETEFGDKDNIKDIYLSGYNSSAVSRVMSGYTILRSIEKCNDYVAGNNKVEISDGVYSLQEIRKVTYVIILEKPNEQDRIKETIDDISETIDMLVLDALEDSARFDDMQDAIDALVLNALEG